MSRLPVAVAVAVAVAVGAPLDGCEACHNSTLNVHVQDGVCLPLVNKLCQLQIPS